MGDDICFISKYELNTLWRPGELKGRSENSSKLKYEILITTLLILMLSILSGWILTERASGKWEMGKSHSFLEVLNFTLSIFVLESTKSPAY